MSAGPSFDRIRYRRHDASAFLYAFDLIELNGDDLRREPLVVRKTTLASLLGQEMLVGLLGSAVPGLRFNEHIEADGPTVFQHACELGLEGIVSKRKDSRYISGRSLHWIKSKNPNAPAVKREAEVDQGRLRPPLVARGKAARHRRYSSALFCSASLIQASANSSRSALFVESATVRTKRRHSAALC
jgi:ATP-dependent DNA ligase